MNPMVTLVLRGGFAVLAPDGRDLTPASRKACALLALLAVSPRSRRSRLWLQQMLWSSRHPAQASGSLRQALLEIRRALGEHAGVLTTSRSAVALQAGGFHLDTAGQARDFLQEFGPVDPPFDAWLEDARRRGATTGTTTTAPAPAPVLRLLPGTAQQVVVHLHAVPDERSGDQTLLLFMREFIGRSLTELHDVKVIHAHPSASADPAMVPALLVDIRTLEIGQGALSLKVSIESSATLQTFWSKVSTPVSKDRFYDDINGCLAFSIGVVHAVSHVIATEQLVPLPGAGHVASVLSATAVRRMFSMRHSEIEAAGGLLNEAVAIHPRGLHHARRAQLAIIQLIERQSNDAQALRDQARDDIAMAMEKEPLNSNVLAAAAHVQNVFEKDHDVSLWLARQSIAANHANPVGWLVLSNALLYTGQNEAAHAAAVKAHGLADQTWLKHWMCFQRSLTAAVSGRLEEAIAYGAASHTLAAHFRPPLRYMVALHARAGDFGKSARAASLLAGLEPGFSVERLVLDRDYPASFIHRARLLDASAITMIAAD